MNYGPYMKTFNGDKTRIKGEYYWLKKNNGYILRKWNGNQLRNVQQNKKNENIIIIKDGYTICKNWPEKSKRIKGTTYINGEGEERYWDGNRLRNKKHEQSYRKQYNEKNREKNAEYSRQYHEKNREKIKERCRVYHKNNYENIKVKSIKKNRKMTRKICIKVFLLIF